MDSQSHQNSSNQRTQKVEDQSKNVLVDEHKHKSQAETGSKTSGRRNDMSRQLVARHNSMFKVNSEDPVATEENIQSVQDTNVDNLRNATSVAQPLRKPKRKYQSIARLSESGAFTTKNKPPRYSNSSSRRNESRSGHVSQRMSERRGYLEPLQKSGISDFGGISHDHRVLLRAANLARDASYLACSNLFWKKLEPIFASVREEDISYLLKELGLSEELHNVDYSSSDITLSQIALSALISEDDITDVEDDKEFDCSDLADMDETHVREIQYDFSDIEYGNLDLKTKFQLELHSNDLYPESSSSKEIDNEIVQLQQRLHQQIASKKTPLKKIYESVCRSRDVASKIFTCLEQVALDKLVQLAYQKLLHNGAGTRSTLPLLRRVLARCREFENGGVSCFNVPSLLDVLSSTSRADCEAEFGTAIASTSSKSSANKATGRRRSLRLSQTVLPKVDDRSKGSSSGAYQKKRRYTRKASTPSHGSVQDTSKETCNHGDSSLQELEGTRNPEDFLGFEDDALGNDFSVGLDIPMDDLSSVDLSIP